MKNHKKLVLALIATGLLTGCNLKEDKPTEKDIKTLLTMNQNGSYLERESNAEEGKPVCLTIPTREARLTTRYSSTVFKDETIAQDAPQRGFDTFVKAGLLEKAETTKYSQGKKVPAIRYSLTSLGAEYLSNRSSTPCFYAGTLVTGGLIPGLDDNGEKEKELIVLKKATKENAKPHSYYQAWVEQKVINKAPWVDQLESTDFSRELRELSNPEAKKVTVAKYKDMWLPPQFVSELMSIEEKIATKSPDEAADLQSRMIEPLLKRYKALSAQPDEKESVSASKIAEILEFAKKEPTPYSQYGYISFAESNLIAPKEYLLLTVKIDPYNQNSSNSENVGSTVVIEKNPDFNADVALQSDLDKYLKANPQSANSEFARELKIKINNIKSKKDDQLNTHQELLDNLDLLVKYGFAIKEEDSATTWKYSFKDGATLAKKGGVTVVQIPAYKYEFGDVLKTKINMNKDVPSLQSNSKTIDLEVALKGTPIERTQPLIKENPGLYVPYTKVAISAKLTDNPGKPYSFSSIKYKR